MTEIDNGYIEEVSKQSLVNELKEKVEGGDFTVSANRKENMERYGDIVKGTDYLKPHIEGNDVGGDLDSAVLEEMSEISDKAENRVLKAKESHMKDVLSSVNEDSIFYDKEIKLGIFEMNGDIDENSAHKLMKLQSIVNNYVNDRFEKPIIDLEIQSNDLPIYNRNSKAEVSIAFNSKELKKNGIRTDELLSEIETRSNNEGFSISSGNDKASKIPANRMKVDDKSLVFTKEEWGKVNPDLKNKFKEEVGVPTQSQLSNKGLSMKL